MLLLGVILSDFRRGVSQNEYLPTNSPPNIHTHTHTHARTHARTHAHLFHFLKCLLNSPLYRVLQVSVGKSCVVLLMLVAIFCSQFPVTTCSRPPKHLLYYVSCMEPCSKELKRCVARCRENNTCEASRKFCSILCLKAWESCIKKCREEAGIIRLTDL